MIERAEITVIGPVNGMGEMDIRGSYVGITVSFGGVTHRLRVSVGQAQEMALALHGLLLDRQIGALTMARRDTIAISTAS
jgi:hypothetical protein